MNYSYSFLILIRFPVNLFPIGRIKLDRLNVCFAHISLLNSSSKELETLVSNWYDQLEHPCSVRPWSVQLSPTMTCLAQSDHDLSDLLFSL